MYLSWRRRRHWNLTRHLIRNAWLCLPINTVACRTGRRNPLTWFIFHSVVDSNQLTQNADENYFSICCLHSVCVPVPLTSTYFFGWRDRGKYFRYVSATQNILRNGNRQRAQYSVEVCLDNEHNVTIVSVCASSCLIRTFPTLDMEMNGTDFVQSQSKA